MKVYVYHVRDFLAHGCVPDWQVHARSIILWNDGKRSFVSSRPYPYFSKGSNTEIIDLVSSGLEEGLRIYHHNYGHSFYEECLAASRADLLHAFYMWRKENRSWQYFEQCHECLRRGNYADPGYVKLYITWDGNPFYSLALTTQQK